MRLALCILLALAASPALAGWVKVSETESSVFYIDSRTIHKSGDLRTVWEIQDLKQKHEDGYMSIRLWAEYDCKERRRRIKSIYGHDKPMAGGQVLMVDKLTGQWIAIAPDTPFSTILGIVCSR